jgi:DivIVA domain-containing protein
LRAVTFRTALRGYNVDDVDQFLERVAVGVSEMQLKLDDALARADQAERDKAESTVSDDAVQRTLTLAQRTADMAMQEAKEEAAKLVADARAEAEAIAEAAQRQLRADIERLETARKQLNDDVRAMQQHVDQERARLRGAMSEILRAIDNSARRPVPPPPSTKIDIPAPVARKASEPAPAAPAASPTAVPEVEPAAVEADPEPVAAEPAPVADAPAPVKREPQPPPVSGTPFGAARPAGGRPRAPPPGPKRASAVPANAPDPSPQPDPEAAASASGGATAGLRRFLGT